VAINDALSQLGIVILPPVSHLEGDTMFVDAIKVGVAPNPTRDLVAGSVVELLQPAREALFQTLLDATCDSAAVITVADILLGSVTGGGSFTVAIGGAQAQLSTDDGPTAPSAAAPRVAPSTGAAPPALGTVPFAVGPTGAAPAGVTGAPPSPLRPRAASARLGRQSDGALAVGLGALALGVALVEADRRKMRQAAAAPSAPTEAPAG
jgi:hypothetical protein